MLRGELCAKYTAVIYQYTWGVAHYHHDISICTCGIAHSHSLGQITPRTSGQTVNIQLWYIDMPIWYNTFAELMPNCGLNIQLWYIDMDIWYSMFAESMPNRGLNIPPWYINMKIWYSTYPWFKSEHWGNRPCQRNKLETFFGSACNHWNLVGVLNTDQITFVWLMNAEQYTYKFPKQKS